MPEDIFESFHLEFTELAPKLAKKFLQITLRDLDVNTARAEYLVEALVQDAIKYGLPPVELTVSLKDDHLTIQVRDANRDPDDGSSEIESLRLVDLISKDWGTQLDENGEVTWFTIDV